MFVPPPRQEATEQAASLFRSGDILSALKIVRLEAEPRVVWLIGGSPAQVEEQTRQTMREAERQHAIPAFAVYNVPGRDCSQYSSGGAVDTAAYAAWVDGVARGIGSRSAIVILEPDGIALSPDQCGAPEHQADRNEQIRAAVDRLGQLPKASVYLDAGHDDWHAVGDIVSRLLSAGVDHADGFFLNVSNYRADPGLIRFGTLVSKCLYWVKNGGGDANDCPNQWWPSEDADRWLASHVRAAPSALKHFVIDSGRNGRGPWDASPYQDAPYYQAGDPQNWCNAPGRGLGVRPTLHTNTPLLDGYLWIKTPGDSDGQCSRNWNYGSYTEAGWPTDASQQSLFDPARNAYDPAAGAWFPEMALTLAENANPPLF